MRAGVKFAIALAVAAGLVVGAVIVRSRLDERGAPRITPVDADKLEMVVCLDELDGICDRLAQGTKNSARVTVESREQTLARLTARDPDPFTLIATSDLVDVAIEAREARTLPALSWLSGKALAHAPLFLVSWADRAKVLSDRQCEPILICVSDIARDGWVAHGGSTTWGPVEFALRDTATSEASRAGLGALAAEHFAQADPPLRADELSSSDLDSPAFDRRLRALADTVPQQSFTSDDPFERMLTVGPAALEMTILSSADLAARPIPASRQGQLVEQAIPDAAVVVVAATAARSSAATRWLESSTGIASLEAGGYRTGGGATSLPAGGVLTALAQRWNEQSS